MRPTMLPTPSTKNPDFVPPRNSRRITRGHLTLEQSGEYHRAPKDVLNELVVEIAASCKRDDTSKAYPSPAVADMARGKRRPLSAIARIISDALKGGGPVDFPERLGHALITFGAIEADRQGRIPKKDNHGAAA